MGSNNSKTLRCNDLIRFIDKPSAYKFICVEHEKIMNMTIPGTFDVSAAAENLEKNGYSNACFDHTRVVLQEDEKYRDYINATYVDGYERTKKYIVSQAPLETTSSCWWKMIWEQKCELIVMLCNPVENGKRQCYRYWSPVEGTTLEFGNLKVKTIKVSSRFKNFQITSIVVTHKNGGYLKLSHFLFDKWHDDILPAETDFFDLVFMTREYDQWTQSKKFLYGWNMDLSNPIVVHCNTGLERAMTFCAVDILLSRCIETGEVNFFSTVVNLRKQRYNCLSDVNQYIFCYKFLSYFVKLHFELNFDSNCIC